MVFIVWCLHCLASFHCVMCQKIEELNINKIASFLAMISRFGIFPIFRYPNIRTN